MNLVINHIDTFNFIKSILKSLYESSPMKREAYGELLKQMEEVPETNDSGFFIDMLYNLSLREQINTVINKWFQIKQEELNITTKDEPYDSCIKTSLDVLVKECERVLEWQKKGLPDPFTIQLNNIKALIPDDDYTDAEKDLIRTFLLDMEMKEAMGPVCYSGHLLIRELKKNGHFCAWVYDCIELYEQASSIL